MISEEYESVYILKSNLKENEKEKIKEKLCNEINSNGEVLKIEDIGIKKLAYTIKKQTHGFYIIIEFKINADVCDDVIKNIECMFRTFEEVIKFIIVKK